MEKLKVSQVIVVEGRYDKAKLSSLVDAVIVTTNGFGIYKDSQTLGYLRQAARRCGVIILTDSDAAGFQIRNYLANAIGEGQVLHAYIPDIYGKERRKASPGREGKLGVEGVEARLIVAALQKAGARSRAQDGPSPRRRSMKTDCWAPPTARRCAAAWQKAWGCPSGCRPRRCLTPSTCC